MTTSRIHRYPTLAAVAALIGASAWSGASAAAPMASTTLVINEIDYRQPVSDTAEFVELKNVGTVGIDLKDYALAGVNTDGKEYRRDAVATTSFILAPGGHYVVCGDAATVPGCQRDLMGTDLWRGGSGTAAYAIGLIRTGARDVLVDSVAYEGRVPNGPNGEVWTEANPVTQADNPSEAYVGISRYPDGTDTDDNAKDVSKRCISPGANNAAAQRPCSAPPTSTPTPTNTATPTATATATRQPTFTPTATSTATATRPPTRTLTPTPTTTATETAAPTLTPTDVPPDVLVFTVTWDGDRGDAQRGDNVCGDGSACTLRAALEEINASNHTGRFVIRFARPMVINVPAGSPLPALTKSYVQITGVNPGEKLPSRVHGSAGPAQLSEVWLKGPGAGSNMVGIELNDTSGVLVQGLKITDFRVGVLVHGGGSDNWVGTLPDGVADAAEGNVIAFNGEAQVRLGSGSNNSVCGNQLGLDPVGTPAGYVTEVGVDLVDGATGNRVGQDEDDRQVFCRFNRIQWRHRFGVRLSGPATQGNRVAGNLIGATAVGDPVDMGNVVGVLLADGATGNTVGGDGSKIELETNHIAFNTADGVLVMDTAVGNTVAFNNLHHNRQHGVRLMRTRGGGTSLDTNRITANGGAAIAYVGVGYEPVPPMLDSVADVGGGLWRVKGRACVGCVVQVFADPADEARDYLGQALSDGSWYLDIPDVRASGVVNITADVRGPDGATSRLASLPVDPDGIWWLHNVPPDGPRAIGAGLNLSRRFRLWNARRQPAANAEVRFTPLDLRAATDGDGYMDVQVPLAVAADFFNRGISFSVEAVSHEDGQVHPVAWYPAMAIAKQREAGADDVILDLTGLGPEGIGGVLRRLGSTMVLGDRLQHPMRIPTPLGVPAAANRAGALAGACTLGADVRGGPAAAGPADDAPAYGAAWTAAPVATFREGQYAWQENMPRGGGLYELKPGGTTLEGQLEIVAPIAAWNPGGPASACTPPGAGAVMCGWNKDKGCWVPVAGSLAVPPEPGAQTVTVRTNVSVPPGGSSFLSALGASEAITLYTVGFDIAPPVITPTIANGMVLSALPDVLAAAVDEHAGVNAKDGVKVTVGGTDVPVIYDAAARAIRISEQSRPLPPGANGPADIVILVTDGFCNQASRTVSVILDASVPPTITPTPTNTPVPTVTPTTAPTKSATSTPTGTVPPTATRMAGTPEPGEHTIYLPICRRRR